MRELEERRQYSMRVKHGKKHVGFIAYFTSSGQPVFTAQNDPDASLCTFQSREHAYRVKAELETGGHLFAQILIHNEATVQMVRNYIEELTVIGAEE